MNLILRALAFTFLTAAILWGCTPIATSLTRLPLLESNQISQTPNFPASVNLTEVVEYAPTIPTHSRVGICQTHSTHVTRTNVWQCSVDDTTYDPCFTVGAEEAIVCTDNLLDPSSSFRVDLAAPLPLHPTPTTATSLNLEDLKSLWFFGIDVVDDAVVLNNGQYDVASSTSNGKTDAANNIIVRLSELRTEGDLDQDGDLDAATVLIASSNDIFSRYYLSTITNENGNAVNSATIPLGDGVRIDNISIENGQIVVDMTSHGAQDPLCCPTVAETRYYSLNQNQLQMYTGAWQVELLDGTLCALPSKGKQGNDYRCSDGRSIVNTLETGALWTGKRPLLGSTNLLSATDLETIAIRRVWQ